MRLLRAILLFVKRIGFRQPPDWKAADAKGLYVFLNSHTGQKLRLHIQAAVLAQNERAVDARGDAYECGVAAGFRALWNHFDSFSAQQVDSPATDEDPNDLAPFHSD